MSDASAQNAWREESNFKRLLDVLPAAAYLCDTHGHITYFNPRAAELWGRSPELNSAADRFCGSLKLFTPNNKPISRERSWMALALRDDKEYNGLEVVIERPDGRRVSVLAHANPLHDETGALCGAVNVLIDITDRKGIEDALLRELGERRRAQEATARLAAIVDTSGDAIVGKTLDGVITSWNRSAERMFGYLAAEAVGRHITLIVPDDRLDEEEDVLARLRRGERIEHFETRRRTKQGVLIDVSLSVSPIIDADGRVIGASKVARDITARKREEAAREDRLDHEQRAREEAESASGMKDHFLALLSHELRTPLSAVLGWTHMLREGRLDTAGRGKALASIERNAHALAQLVDGLLDISRVASGKLDLKAEAVDLPSIVRAAVDTIRPVAEMKGIGLLIDVPPRGSLAVTGDADRLQQVVWNLLANAVKFTPSGGQAEIALRARGGEAEIVVRDTGEGIAPVLLPHVFEQFRQGDSTSARRHGGLGLGLAIVHHLIEAHGGTAQAESQGPGKGSTFTVRLPVSAFSPAAASAPGGADAADMMLGGLRILVVDDDADTRDLMHLWLEGRGARVITAASTAEALRAFDAEPIDVLLADIGMPGQDGYALIRSIRRIGSERARRVTAVAITAYASPRERREALAAGFDAHVAKPIRRPALLAAIAALISTARPRVSSTAAI